MIEIISRTKMRIVKNERLYELECSNDSPFGEVFDVLCEMQVAVIDKMQNSMQQDRQIKENNFPEQKEESNG